MRTHGTRAMYVVEKCRCEPCRHAHRTYARFQQKRRRLGRTQGAWALPYVNAEPIRAHIAELRAAGVGYRRIAELAGITRSSLVKIINGRRQVRRETAQAVLAVSADQLAPTALVDATDTWAKVRWILEQPGWTKTRLARELGQRGVLQLGRHRVTVRNAAAVAAVYERLWSERIRRRSA
jgi:transcriptional regulator with XRE-family HTH domain